MRLSFLFVTFVVILSAASPQTELRKTCTRCHDLEVIRAQRLTRQEWRTEVRKMERMGAVVRNREELLDYLAKKYGRRAGQPAPGTE